MRCATLPRPCTLPTTLVAAVTELDLEFGARALKAELMKLAGNRLRFGAAALLTMAGVALAVPNLASAHNSAQRRYWQRGVGISSDEHAEAVAHRSPGHKATSKAGRGNSVGGRRLDQERQRWRQPRRVTVRLPRRPDHRSIHGRRSDVGGTMKDTSHADVHSARRQGNRSEVPVTADAESSPPVSHGGVGSHPGSASGASSSHPWSRYRRRPRLSTKWL